MFFFGYLFAMLTFTFVSFQVRKNCSNLRKMRNWWRSRRKLRGKKDVNLLLDSLAADVVCMDPAWTSALKTTSTNVWRKANVQRVAKNTKNVVRQRKPSLLSNGWNVEPSGLHNGLLTKQVSALNRISTVSFLLWKFIKILFANPKWPWVLC